MNCVIGWYKVGCKIYTTSRILLTPRHYNTFSKLLNLKHLRRDYSSINAYGTCQIIKVDIQIKIVYNSMFFEIESVLKVAICILCFLSLHHVTHLRCLVISTFLIFLRNVFLHVVNVRDTYL